MKSISNTSNKLRNILAYLLSIIYMLVLAYVDYVTSDYSLILFYILIVSASTWYTTIGFGVLSATFCGIVQAVSDYYVHGSEVFAPIYYWNWICNFLIYVTLAFIIHYLTQLSHMAIAP